MKILITGVAGFIGSHLADYFIERGHEVVGIDNLLTGSVENINKKVFFIEQDIRNYKHIEMYFQNADWVFHEAAIARTPWTIDDPTLCHDTNVTGTFNVLKASLEHDVKRVVIASSNIVYAANTPYKASKLATEQYAKVFNDTYGLSTICLRYSNVYGSLRQSEQGPAVNCIASLRKSKRENGYIWITGDGEQTRQFTHIDDICRANELAVKSKHIEPLDICTGEPMTMNSIAKLFKCPIQHVEERRGDVKHIDQSPVKAFTFLKFKAKVPFKKGIQVYL